LAVAEGGGVEFVRYDAKHHKFGPPVRFATSDPTTDLVYLLDPALAHGSVAVVIHQLDGETGSETSSGQITEIHSVPENENAWEITTKEPRTIRLPAPDWQRVFGGDLSPILTLAPTIRTSPDGKLVARLANGRIALAPRAKPTEPWWLLPAFGVTDIRWSPEGTLLAIGSGVAEIDAYRGAIIDRQCGWRFGLYDKPVMPDTGPLLCDSPD
jgi:hypothetical protein